MKRVIVICSFGDRHWYINTLLNSLQKNVPNNKLEIVLITDKIRNEYNNVEQIVLTPDDFKWQNSNRWPVRNTNLWLAKSVFWRDYESVCCLNDDMYICNNGFMDGFALAEKFGVCVPTNPRIYVKYNAMGADATEQDRKIVDEGPIYGPSCNVSPMFVCRLNKDAERLLQAYIEKLDTCMRGTLAFWLASYETAVTPVYLPEQWCVCESNANYFKNYKKVLQGKEYKIEPVILHVGQKGVRDIFKGTYNGLD